MDDTIRPSAEDCRNHDVLDFQTSGGGETDQRIEECVARLTGLVRGRDALHGGTAVDVDFVGGDMPREWSDFEAQLDDVLNALLFCKATHQAGLLNKFYGLELLTGMLEPEDRRVIRMKDALLQECRSFVEGLSPPLDRRTGLFIGGRPGPVPSLLRFLAGSKDMPRLNGSRRSQG